MVSTSGSKAVAIQPSSASEAPRSSQDRRSRARTSSTSSARSCDRIHHRWPGSTCCSRCQVSGSLSEPRSSRRAAPGPARSTAGAAQVGACTPLVIDPIGTSFGSKPGHSSLNIVAADPAVQQRHPVGALRQPQAHVGHVELRRVVLGAERDDPVQRHPGQQPRVRSRRPARCRSSACTISTGNRSMPAGTGVWVVNTVRDRTTASAVSKSSPASMPARGSARRRGIRRGPRSCGRPRARAAPRPR